MSGAKRGLGRGLEALLTEVSSPKQLELTTKEIEAQVVVAMTLIKAIHKERAELLQEAENINEFLCDFETTIRHP